MFREELFNCALHDLGLWCTGLCALGLERFCKRFWDAREDGTIHTRVVSILDG